MTLDLLTSLKVNHVFVLFWVFFVGKLAVEGKVDHKFDMKPHNENFEEYGRMCRERTNKSMVKNRQIQVRNQSCYFSHSFVHNFSRKLQSILDFLTGY